MFYSCINNNKRASGRGGKQKHRTVQMRIYYYIILGRGTWNKAGALRSAAVLDASICARL